MPRGPHSSTILAALAASLSFTLACSRGDAPTIAPASDTTELTAGDAPATKAAAAPAAASASFALPTSKTYRKVLHAGDSMVGGGLCRALKPLFATDGTKFVRDVWESGSIEDFAGADRLPKLLARHDPDLVLLTLGANDVGGKPSDWLAKRIEKVARMTQKGKARDCVWIGPPKWRVDGKPIIEMIRAHAAPCVFFDSTDVEMERKDDKIHPNEHGGEQWATAFWRAFRGSDRLPAGPDGGAIFPLPLP